MSIDPNAYTSSTAGTIKLGTKSLTGSDAIDVLTGTASEVAQPLYYPQNTKPQQSDYAATDQMSNVGAALFDSSTSYQSFFDKYKNVAGGLRPLNEDFLESVYYTPEPPPDDTPPPPPAALKPPEIPSHDSGVDDPFSGNFQDPFAVDDPTVTADQSQAVPGTEGPDFFSRGDLSEAQGRESGSARGPQGATSLAQWAGGIMEGIMGLTTFMPSSIALNVLNELTGGKPPPSKVEPPARSVGTGRSAAGGQGNPPSNPDSFSGVGAAASTGDDAAAYSDSGPSGTPPSYSSIGLD